MADKYDDLIDSALSDGGGDNYDRMISDAVGPTTSSKQSGLDYLLNAAGLTLDKVAAAGRAANDAAQNYAGNMMEGAGFAESKLGLPEGALRYPAMTMALPGAVGAEAQLPKDRLGAALTLGTAAAPLVSKGAELLSDAAAPVAKKLGETAYKVAPNVYPATARYALDNWERVMQAPTVEAARDLYAKAAGGLKHWSESMAERFGTLRPSAHIDEVVSEAQQFLEGKGANVEMNPQRALDAIQGINLKERSAMAEIKDSTLRAQVKGEFDTMKNKLYDYLETNGKPAMREAARALRDAFVKEDITRMFPANKGGDANVLRGVGAGYKITEGIQQALGGEPMKGAMNVGIGTMFSPKAYTGVLNNIYTASKLASDPSLLQAILEEAQGAHSANTVRNRAGVRQY